VLEGRPLRDLRDLSDAEKLAKLTALVDAWHAKNSTIALEAAAARTREIDDALVELAAICTPSNANAIGVARDLIRAHWPSAFPDKGEAGR
jgi:hypothetical protein